MKLIEIKLVSITETLENNIKAIPKSTQYIDFDKIQTIIPHTESNYYTIVFDNGEWLDVWNGLKEFLDTQVLYINKN